MNFTSRFRKRNVADDGLLNGSIVTGNESPPKNEATVPKTSNMKLKSAMRRPPLTSSPEDLNHLSESSSPSPLVNRPLARRTPRKRPAADQLDAKYEAVIDRMLQEPTERETQNTYFGKMIAKGLDSIPIEQQDHARYVLFTTLYQLKSGTYVPLHPQPPPQMVQQLVPLAPIPLVQCTSSADAESQHLSLSVQYAN